MTTKMRIPYPEIGAALALWESPTRWYADIVVTGQLYGGDVTMRLVRCAEPALDSAVGDADLAGKILRSCRWLIRGAKGGHGSCVKTMDGEIVTQAPRWTPPPDPRGNVKTRKAKALASVREMYDDESLPSYAETDKSGRAVLVQAVPRFNAQPSLNR